MLVGFLAELVAAAVAACITGIKTKLGFFLVDGCFFLFLLCTL
jgi:hypothetical protein